MSPSALIVPLAGSLISRQLHSSSYIGARLIWGTWNSYNLFLLLFSPKAEAANVGPIRYLYIGINIMLNSLNFFWFRAMILALKKR